ncbi:MAG TPA: hypothetical protein VGR05_02650 [Sphingomicrobium sp.]|nr:hypothetical protein [Sphingomicrobium sp.]
MRQFCVFALALCAVQPTDLWAQSPYDSTESGDTITPKNATIFGGSEQVARNMLSAMRLQRRERDLCWEVGCVVIVNESQQYAVTAFHIDSSVRTGKPGWGNNQLATPLRAMKATYRVKLAETKSCDLPVQFVLRHVETREQVTVEGRTDLCMSPQRVSMIRLKVVTPKVIVEPQEPAAR